MDVVEARAPTLARGFAALCARAESRERLHPLRVLELSSFCAHRDSVVDIACKERPRGCYAGDERARQHVELKFGDFVDLYQACFADRPHWLRDVGDLEFYLCQCPVAVAKPDATCSEPRLPRVMEDLLVPECLKDVQLSQVNLWMSTHAARTGLHFDAYQNMLVVFFGRKVVTLYKPSECANLYPFPVYSKSANHSQVNATAPDLENHPRFSKAKPMQFTVSAGDALFIPEGWWHQVDSDEFTIAVNYWWEGARVELTKNPDMMPYYARVLMDELIKRETDGYLAELRVSHKIDVGVDDVSTIISQFLDTSEKTTRERIVMAVEDQVQQRELQQCLATEHPSAWLALLRGASNELSAVLTGFWDTMADDEGFMTQIFSPLGDDEEGTKDALLRKRDMFRQEMGVRACSSLFGIP